MTEVGRQPWIVFGLQRTVDGISPSVSATQVWITLIGFFILYTIMGIVEVSLLIKFVRLGPEAEEPEPENPDLSLLQNLT